MLAKTICPMCKKEVTEDCTGCITGGSLIHNCRRDKDGTPIVQNNIKWKVIKK